MSGKKNSKRNKMLLLLVLLVGFISIGYAILSTSLNINGTSKITNAKWSVHFVEGSIATTADSNVTATTAPTINKAALTGNSTPETGDKIEYGVTLDVPGDKYQFTVEVVNDGSIDAKLDSVTLEGVSPEQEVYTNYSVVHVSDDATKNETTPEAGEILAANGGKIKLLVTVEFDRNIENDELPTEAQTLNLTFGMNYVQA